MSDEHLLSHLREREFKQSFQDYFDVHIFFLHFPLF